MFTPAFRKPRPYLKAVRVAFFGGFALTGMIPIFHSIAMYGWVTQDHRISLWYILGLMAINAAGAAAYALRVGSMKCEYSRLVANNWQFPERFFPQTFDIFGNSHQIMHVLVVCAALVHVLGLTRDFDNLYGHPLACS